MGKGGYLGGSTIIFSGNAKISVRSEKKLSKKKRVRRQQNPGIQVLSPEEQRELRQRFADSRRESMNRRLEAERTLETVKTEARDKVKSYFSDGSNEKHIETASGSVLVERKVKK